MTEGSIGVNYEGFEMSVINYRGGYVVMTSTDKMRITYNFDPTLEKHKSLVDVDSKLKHLMESVSICWTEFLEKVPEHVFRIFKMMLRAILEGKIDTSIYVTVEDDFLVFIHPPITRAGELKYQNMSDEDILSYVCDPSNMNRDLYYSSSEDESLEDDSSDSESEEEFKLDPFTESLVLFRRRRTDEDPHSDEEEDLSSDEEFNFDAFVKALSHSRGKHPDEDPHGDEI